MVKPPGPQQHRFDVITLDLAYHFGGGQIVIADAFCRGVSQPRRDPAISLKRYSLSVGKDHVGVLGQPCQLGGNREIRVWRVPRCQLLPLPLTP